MKKFLVFLTTLALSGATYAANIDEGSREVRTGGTLDFDSPSGTHLEFDLLLGFFLSPVLYSTQWLPPAAQALAALNPMTGLLGLYRWAVLGVPLPSALASLALGIAILVLSVLARTVFGRLRPLLDEYW